MYIETVVVLVMLIVGIVSVRTVRRYFSGQGTLSKSLAHVVPPKRHNVKQQRQRANALLSRLDSDSADLVKNYIDEDDSVMRLLSTNRGLECYRTLREAMIKLFGKAHVGTTVAQSQFVGRAQLKEENIHRYYSNLKNLSKIAFPTLSPSQRKELTDTRFIDGINNDELRQKILDHLPKKTSQRRPVCESTANATNSPTCPRDLRDV